MLSPGCAAAFISLMCLQLLLLSRAGELPPDILRLWGPTDSLPQAAGRVPEAATTMSPLVLGRGLPAVPGSEQVTAPSTCHRGKRPNENRGGLSSSFFLRTTDR